LIVLEVLLLSLVVTLLGRLAYLQAAGGSRGAALVGQGSQIVSAPRGVILDQTGQPLAANRTAVDVVVDRAALKRQPDAGAASLAKVAAAIGDDEAVLRVRMIPCGQPGAAPGCFTGAATEPLPVAKDVPVGDVLDLIENPGRYPGVSVVSRSVRTLPAVDGAKASHLLGYLGSPNQQELDEDPSLAPRSQVGRTGLEAQYESELRGRDGSRTVVTAADGTPTVVSERPAQPGNYVVTSIDVRLQAVVERELAAALQRAQASGLRGDSGAAVVLDVTNGQVLALASAPDYDPGMLTKGVDQATYDQLSSDAGGRPLLNRVTQGDLAPASTFKVISTAAAVAAGYDLDGSYPCPSSYEIAGQVFRNYESESYGDISFARALEVSCDTVFYRIAHNLWQTDGGSSPQAVPKDQLIATARGFGLGTATGIDLPGESTGRIVDRQRKQSDYAELGPAYCRRAQTGYPEEADPAQADLFKKYAAEYCADGDKYRAGDAVNFAIGQGDSLATPLQIATMYAAIANGGTLFEPHLAKAILAPDGTPVRTIEPKRNGRLPASAETLDYIQEALVGVPRDGTAKIAFSGFPLGQIPIAAKTGTAEVDGRQTTSWFASYAPADKPRYAVVFMVTQGGTGAGTSGPSVRGVYEALFGVVDGVAGRAPSVLPGGEPQSALPQPAAAQGTGGTPSARPATGP
jgi:penicillin-binding protein 2